VRVRAVSGWPRRCGWRPIRRPPGDRHVLAAAIEVGAQTIVTDNLKDFPADRLAPWDVEGSSADDFLHAMVDLSPKIVFALVQKMANSLTLSPTDVAVPSFLGLIPRAPRRRSEPLNRVGPLGRSRDC
jgi:hypothetical protein